jgi:hypothetical protein
MVPPEYANFLIASTGASAALLGLLFVSISIAPERIFGSASQAGHRSLALTSFTALANAFFVSLGGLIPHVIFGPFVIVAGVIALSQSLSLLLNAKDWRDEGRLLRGVTLFIAGLSIYGGEIALGLQLMSQKDTTGLLTVLLELLLAVFAIGLVRAWELLGAPHARGLGTGAIEWVEGRLDRKHPREQPPKP